MSRTVPRRAALAAALALAGCVAYESAPLDPGAELAALRGTSLDGFVVRHARPGASAPVSAARFDLADGIDEAELVSIALTLHPALAARRLELGEAQAQLVTAGLWPNPEIGLSWRPGVGGAAGHSVDMDLLVDLLQPARRQARADAAASRCDEVRAEVAAEEARLVRDVRLQRLAVLAAEQALALLGEETSLREESLALARRRRDAGEATELDLAASEMEAAEVRGERRRAETDLRGARRALNELLGLPPGYVVRLADSGLPSAVTVFEDVPDAELERRLLAGRFELRALEAAHARAGHELRLAVESAFPALRLGLAAERDAGGDAFLGPAAELEIPLFDRNQGEIAERRTARDRARAAYVEALHRLRAQAWEARETLRAARAEVEAQAEEVLPVVERSRRLAEAAYRAREVGALERVAVQERALRARRTWIDAVAGYLRGVVELESATGLPLAAPAAAPEPTDRNEKEMP